MYIHMHGSMINALIKEWINISEKVKENPLTLSKVSREYFLKDNKANKWGKGQVFQTEDGVSQRCSKIPKEKSCSQLDWWGPERCRTIHVKPKGLDVPAFSKVDPLEQSWEINTDHLKMGNYLTLSISWGFTMHIYILKVLIRTAVKTIICLILFYSVLSTLKHVALLRTNAFLSLRINDPQNSF